MILDKVYILFHYNIHFEGLSPEGALTSVIVFKIVLSRSVVSRITVPHLLINKTLLCIVLGLMIQMTKIKKTSFEFPDENLHSLMHLGGKGKDAFLRYQ